jgi:TIR domain
MAHYKLFISYSSEDQNIIDFIESELVSHDQFQPLIIARNREPLKPLSEKVIKGLTEAEIVIPVLTKKSINTQWINQEIGYATAINKKISPVVENEIINQLKGFIHNQVDIPYNYIGNVESIEGFKEAFRMLIKDLEEEYIQKQRKNESAFSKGLAKIQEGNKQKELEQKKQSLLESEKGFKDFSNEMKTIEEEFRSRVKLLNDTNVYPDIGSTRNPISFSLGKYGYVSTIEIHQPYINTTVGSFLSLGRFKGLIDANGPYNNYELISGIKYKFYYDNDLNPIWKRYDGIKEEISTKEIVESCFNWFLDRIIEKSKS